jgi:hypothetical protein
MNTLKRKNAMEYYDGFKGVQTVNAVMQEIPDELADSLTGKQLGMVMSAVNSAYHNGRDSTGAEMLGNDTVYISSQGKIITWKVGNPVFDY